MVLDMLVRLLRMPKEKTNHKDLEYSSKVMDISTLVITMDGM